MFGRVFGCAYAWSLLFHNNPSLTSLPLYVSSQGYENNILRYYVDGEKEASVAFPFGLGHGSTMVDNDGPWSAGSVFGKTGEPSGTHTYIYKLTSNNRM